jgi:hypothetical protein
VRFLKEVAPDRPFFLWLHYVNPHAPYRPPPPYHTAFLDDASHTSPRLVAVEGFRDGIRREWAVPGRDRLGYYVAQYDGEIATADAEIGRVLEALGTSAGAGRTLVVLTSDHGESLGEHDYYFDHGEDLFDPSLAVPLIVRLPGTPPPAFEARFWPQPSMWSRPFWTRRRSRTLRVWRGRVCFQSRPANRRRHTEVFSVKTTAVSDLKYQSNGVPPDPMKRRTSVLPHDRSGSGPDSMRTGSVLDTKSFFAALPRLMLIWI